MRSKPKIKSVSDVVDRIIILREEIKKREDELARLNSLQFQELDPEPDGFDYKEAIVRFFNDNPNSIANLDKVLGFISEKYSFAPNRNTLSLRVGYLADHTDKIERVEGKRGFYRLRKNRPSPEPQRPIATLT